MYLHECNTAIANNKIGSGSALEPCQEPASYRIHIPHIWIFISRPRRWSSPYSGDRLHPETLSWKDKRQSVHVHLWHQADLEPGHLALQIGFLYARCLEFFGIFKCHQMDLTNTSLIIFQVILLRDEIFGRAMVNQTPKSSAVGNDPQGPPHTPVNSSEKHLGLKQDKNKPLPYFQPQALETQWIDEPQAAQCSGVIYSSL